MFNGFTLHKDFMRVCNGYCELGGSVDKGCRLCFSYSQKYSIIFKTIISKILIVINQSYPTTD